MPIGNGSKRNRAAGSGDIRAVGLRFPSGRLIVERTDERDVSVSLRRYPTLQRARAAFPQ